MSARLGAPDWGFRRTGGLKAGDEETAARTVGCRRTGGLETELAGSRASIGLPPDRWLEIENQTT